jgi:phosphatidylglycerol:prolipoprotein diacylglycerol transferase
MPLTGPYVHSLDPIIASVFGVQLWWYGLGYAVGFLCVFFHLRGQRDRLELSRGDAYDLTLLVSVGVLLGGRLVQVVFYEWTFYAQYPRLIPALWIGGMASHGLLLGAVVGIGVFCLARHRPFFELTDALAAPAAFILAAGRIGNFIDGQIVGSLTDVWWAVRFPDAEGFRHPVVLYDALKNLLLVPVLVAVARRRPRVGTTTGLFLFLYAFLRLFIDLFREYPTTLLGLATGQALNLALSVVGLLLLVGRREPARPAGAYPARGEGWLVKAAAPPGSPVWRRVVLASLALFTLVIPSDWTQDVPARYGKRHPGLTHSSAYPRIDEYRADMRERALEQRRAERSHQQGS